MSFYDLSKEQRQERIKSISQELLTDIKEGKKDKIHQYFSDEDTYIRKASYQSIGKIYHSHKDLQAKIINLLNLMLQSKNEKVRQTTINSAGEIGMKYFTPVEFLMEAGLFDDHHVVRNAVIGSIKKMGEKNPIPVLAFAKRFLHHENPEIRREICHGIELRGRTHPQEILPLLKELEFDEKPRVRNTLIHVIGQISYKKGCLETVINHLKSWQNNDLVEKAIEEIIDVHERYKDFAVKTQEEAKSYIENNFL